MIISPMIQIRSTGIVCTRGRGLLPLEAALEAGWNPPVEKEDSDPNTRVPAFHLPDGVLQDRAIMGKMRRADRLSKMATLAACDAWAQAGLSALDPRRVGVLLATGLGPHARTFRFLDGILDFGDCAVSPTDFSHSVHNAAAAYITARLQTHGPVQTLTDFDFAFHHVLQLAGCWLHEGRCDAVLAGAADELGAVMLHVCAHMLDIPADGCPRPLAFSDAPSVVPGEGAVFFVLTRPEGGCISPLVCVLPGAATGADMTIADAGGMSGPESAYLDIARRASVVANYTPVFGSMMTGAAFHCASAARMIEKGVCYANPLPETEHDLPVCKARCDMGLDGIDCVKRGRDGSWRTISLRRGMNGVQTG